MSVAVTNTISLSAKYGAGYNFHERFSGGLTGKFFYDLWFRTGPNENSLSYGAGAFMRAKITNEIYLQGEYGVSSYEDFFVPRDIYTYPLIGGGYENGQGPWTGGLNVLVILDGDLVENVLGGWPFEWWFTYTYNF